MQAHFWFTSTPSQCFLILSFYSYKIKNVSFLHYRPLQFVRAAKNRRTFDFLYVGRIFQHIWCKKINKSNVNQKKCYD